MDTPIKTAPAYEMEVYLSTDGKHTVHIKVLDNNKTEEALTKAKVVYNAIVEVYGVKNTGVAKKPVSTLTRPCLIHEGELMKEYISKTSGKPYFGHYVTGEGMCFGKILDK